MIQVLKPKFRVDETIEEIKECLEKGWTGIGFKTEKFEDEWKSYSGFRNAHFLNSATAGLHLAIKIFKEELDWRDGDEIITSPLTFVSTNHAILYENLSPVFADVDKSLCLDPDVVRKLITKNTRAVIYVGVGGNAENYLEIKKICEEYKITFILDAAHMSGTKWRIDGSHVGLDADCTVFSYQAVKNCPSSDAGMVCFKSNDMDSRARRLSWLGIDKSTYDRYSESSYKWRYEVPDLGYKYNGNSIAASICLVSLKYLDVDNSYRRRLSDIYTEHLSQLEDVEIIHHSEDILSSRHLFQISVNNRDALIDKLARKGIYCGVHYVANNTYSIYRKYRSDSRLAESYSSSLISLPLHLGVTDDDVIKIAAEISGQES
jgi:dTDP-4-amino-4,6-dideoxygalactose transaminase